MTINNKEKRELQGVMHINNKEKGEQQEYKKN